METEDFDTKNFSNASTTCPAIQENQFESVSDKIQTLLFHSLVLFLLCYFISACLSFLREKFLYFEDLKFFRSAWNYYQNSSCHIVLFSFLGIHCNFFELITLSFIGITLVFEGYCFDLQSKFINRLWIFLDFETVAYIFILSTVAVLIQTKPT